VSSARWAYANVVMTMLPHSSRGMYSDGVSTWCGFVTRGTHLRHLTDVRWHVGSLVPGHASHKSVETALLLGSRTVGPGDTSPEWGWSTRR
jgi:hypothetical protein